MAMPMIPVKNYVTAWLATLQIASLPIAESYAMPMIGAVLLEWNTVCQRSAEHVPHLSLQYSSCNHVTHKLRGYCGHDVCDGTHQPLNVTRVK